MRRYALFVVALAALTMASAVGIASAAGGEGPITVKVGDEGELTQNLGFTPKALERDSYMPIRLLFGQEIHVTGHVPAERELRIELDRNLRIQTKGLPACAPHLQSGLTIDEACEGAVIGSGEEKVDVDYPETSSVRLPAKVEVFNGGERDGAITLYVSGSFGNPISGALTTKFVLTRIHDGRFGWFAAAKLPQIADGFGSVDSLDLNIGKRYVYKSRKVSVLSARCIDGELRGRLQTAFVTGANAEAEFVRACTPKG
jgi:hypothetical protein